MDAERGEGPVEVEGRSAGNRVGVAGVDEGTTLVCVDEGGGLAVAMKLDGRAKSELR